MYALVKPESVRLRTQAKNNVNREVRMNDNKLPSTPDAKPSSTLSSCMFEVVEIEDVANVGNAAAVRSSSAAKFVRLSRSAEDLISLRNATFVADSSNISVAIPELVLSSVADGSLCIDAAYFVEESFAVNTVPDWSELVIILLILFASLSFSSATKVRTLCVCLRELWGSFLVSMDTDATDVLAGINMSGTVPMLTAF